MAGRRISAARRRSVVIGAVVVVIFALLGVFSEEAKKGLPGSPKTVVKARFVQLGSQLNNLNEVTIRGDRAGAVSNIQIDQGKAVVTMELRGAHQMYADASAQINDYALLGQEVIDLTPGTPTRGPLRGTIPVSRTLSATNLEDVLNVFTAPTRNALRTTLTQLGGGTAGRGGDLNRFLGTAPSTLDDVSQIAAAADSPQAKLAQLLNTAKTLSGRFDGRSAELSTLMTQVNDTLDAVNVGGDGPLRQIVGALPGTLQRANVALLALERPLSDTQTAVSDLAPGAASLGQATPDLRGFLLQAVGPLDRVPGVARLVTPAVGDLSQTLGDARPLVPRVDEGLAAILPPLQILSAYRGDVQKLAYVFDSFLANHDAAGGDPFHHDARFNLPINFGSVNGVFPQSHDAYPPPGVAFTERSK